MLIDRAPHDAARVHIQANTHTLKNHWGLRSTVGKASPDRLATYVYLNEGPSLKSCRSYL